MSGSNCGYHSSLKNFLQRSWREDQWVNENVSGMQIISTIIIRMLSELILTWVTPTMPEVRPGVLLEPSRLMHASSIEKNVRPWHEQCVCCFPPSRGAWPSIGCILNGFVRSSDKLDTFSVSSVSVQCISVNLVTAKPEQPGSKDNPFKNTDNPSS